MKKLLLLFTALLSLGVTARAGEQFTWRNFYFKELSYEKREAAITGYIVPTGDMNIPTQALNTRTSRVYSIVAIGSKCFYNCNISYPDIPNTVTSIGASAFAECRFLQRVSIPNSVTEIGSSAFAGCTKLTSVIIPNSVTRIENNTFDGCTRLTSVIIPTSVTEIGDLAFNECTSLTKIFVRSITPPICGPGSFDNVPDTATVYIPHGSLKAYSEAEGWRNFTGLHEMEAFDINIDKKLLWLAVDNQESIIASGNTEGAKWTTSASSIANVDAGGVVKAVSPGTATISLSATDSYGFEYIKSCTVNVMKATFEMPEDGIAIGKVNTITAKVNCPKTEASYYWTLTKAGESSISTEADTYSFPTTVGVNWTIDESACGEYDLSLHITPAGYDKELVFAHPTIKIESAGVEDIEADSDNSPAEYFNLNGVHVKADALAPGLYIKRQGSKASKVLVK